MNVYSSILLHVVSVDKDLMNLSCKICKFFRSTIITVKALANMYGSRTSREKRRFEECYQIGCVTVKLVVLLSNCVLNYHLFHLLPWLCYC